MRRERRWRIREVKVRIFEWVMLFVWVKVSWRWGRKRPLLMARWQAWAYDWQRVELLEVG